MKHTLQRQIFPPHLGIVIAVTAAVTLYSAFMFRSFYHAEKTRELTEDARNIAVLIPKTLFAPAASPGEADRFADSLSGPADERITLLLPDGTVTGDSEEDPERMDNHADRLEIAEALSGKPGVSVRYSETLSRVMMYVAVPVRENGRILGVVRVASSMEDINLPLTGLFTRSAVLGIVVALLTAAASYILSRRISKPIVLMRRAALRYSRGELDFRLAVDRPDELHTLAETLNDMAGQLRLRIQTITGQRNELESILANMTEAVFLLDVSLRIRTLNAAARKLSGPAEAPAAGLTLLEYLRNAGLHDFAERAFASPDPLEEDLTLFTEPVVHLQAHGTVLRSGEGDRTGVLLVLNDISRLVRLEEVRKDFVANVSHELRTPITSIRGFVETLAEGAVEEPETARRFLGIIGRHAERLSAVMDDLLTLSRLEQGDREPVRLEEADIGRVVLGAIELSAPGAQAKNITVESSVPAHPVTAGANIVLLEQAVHNLLDNAVKYSDPGSTVRITVLDDAEAVRISVVDSGCGIPARDLDRIFERFYRVDRARSRARGGTGLGLAIVRHIMRVHRGEVTVESTPGSGSTFTLILRRFTA